MMRMQGLKRVRQAASVPDAALLGTLALATYLFAATALRAQDAPTPSGWMFNELGTSTAEAGAA